MEEGDNDQQDKLFRLEDRVKHGSFMPAIAALAHGHLDIEKPIDEVSGNTLLHYASYYGHIKAMRYIF